LSFSGGPDAQAACGRCYHLPADHDSRDPPANVERTDPILPELRLFEMPLLGYAGFPAFAVECFAMYLALRRFVWRAATRPISI
jgi:hypothetical protein